MKWMSTLLPLLAALHLAAAEPWTVMRGLPECAQTCFNETLVHTDCTTTTKDCICHNKTIIAEVSACVAKPGACSVKQQLTTQNSTYTNCDYPVRDKTQKFVDVTVILGTITAVIIVLRVVSKIWITHSDFGLDDLFILLAFGIGLPSTIMNCVGTAAHGEGKDIWTLEFPTITRFLLFFWVLEYMYFLQVALLKMSLLFFYIRIFVGGTQKILWATVVFNGLYGVAFVFLAAFQCSPVSHFWNHWDGEHKGTCLNANAIGWANAAISVALDIWMLAVPLWNLKRLNLHWKKKIGVAAMFVVGTFVTVVSIVRLQFLVDLGASFNVTYDQTEVSIWSTIEINVGIMCACMPALRILLVRLFPVLGGSSHDSSKYHQYGDTYGHRSRVTTRSRALVELPSRDDDNATPDHGGIEMKRTFKVQYSDGDEASLVAQRQGFGTNKGHHGSTATSGVSQSDVSL